MNLTEACVRKPVLAWMLMAATVVFGVVAGGRIGISQFPDGDFPHTNAPPAAARPKAPQPPPPLPRDMDPPVISKSNPEDQPIMMVRLGGPYPQRVLSDYVRYGLKEKLQTIPGIGEISLMGTRARN